jgi:multidrug efflux pump subunit AcrA (membrane-fusion protein)
MAFLSLFAVGHWRRKGAMTPMEAQAANMENMPAPVGQVAVTLATVTRGPVAASARYTGTAVGYVEQDIYPRTQGWITWMPFYPGDRVHRDELLAKLDTTELQERVAERQAAQRMAEHQAEIAHHGYLQSLASAAQAQAEIGSKQGMLQDARDQKRRAEAAVKEARNEMVQARNEVAEAREEVAGAQAERSEAQADLAAAQTMVPDADAQLAAAKSDQTYLGAELQRSIRLQAQGVIATAELQKDRAAAQNADSKVSQAQARIRQVQEQIRAAQSKAQKAEASERAANSRIAQMTAKFDASQAKVEQAQADIASAGAKIDQAQADVEAAKANARAMQAASGIAQHQIEHSEAGVSEARAAVTTQKTIAGYTEIRSLVDGVVTQRNISPGVLVGPGQSILKVAQIHPIRIQANVPEADLARIRRGDRVRILAPADARGAARQLASTVSAVFPAVDPSARQGIVEALLPNGDNRFLPGQFVTMEVTTAERPDALRIRSAVILWRTEPSQFGQSGKQQAYVWLAEAAGGGAAPVYTCPMHPEVRSDKPGDCPKCKMTLVPIAAAGKWNARRADVAVGVSDGTTTEVTSGLKEGDHVVASGYQNLHDGDALLVANDLTPPVPSPQVERGSRGSDGGELRTPNTEDRTPPSSSSNSSSTPNAQRRTPNASQGRYYCPMHPEVTSDDPNATCPKCGMKLMPRPGARR